MAKQPIHDHPDPIVPPPHTGDWTPPPGYPPGYPPPGYPPYPPEAYRAGQVPPPLNIPQQAKHIIDKHAWWAAAAGLFPLVEADMILIAGTNFLMVRELSVLYGVPFSASRARSVVAALLAGALPSTLAGAFGLSRVLRYVPFVGQTLVPFGTSVFAAAVTYTIGRSFSSYYASGGTLHNLHLEADGVRKWLLFWDREGTPPPSPPPPATAPATA
jgi:uncharacterized protein (DUF697 family)